jgi:serine/threonine protein phosphatase PrpC
MKKKLFNIRPLKLHFFLLNSLLHLYNSFKGFLDIDNAMLNDEQIKEQMAGTTAICVLIRDNKLYCANAGDSRAIASRNGTLVTLSNDHKPNNPEEMDRIYNAGGWVEFNRVNGNLALSRALGDFLFKRNQLIPPEQQIVTGNKMLYMFHLHNSMFYSMKKILVLFNMKIAFVM